MVGAVKFWIVAIMFAAETWSDIGMFGLAGGSSVQTGWMVAARKSLGDLILVHGVQKFLPERLRS